ncbi:cytochrome C oxidase subunit IV family protein [uncultured Cocleimonas sp.]|uniref:cytochrome C oxidase subunit IV family protein n=1 Tax=uncultured Cocleimonas sp. TaxID=1051587 RepID=UPI00260F1288|nr:cytochrome C oxidase subunit IV family protein [uncultured Cocleimonas sp.]
MKISINKKMTHIQLINTFWVILISLTLFSAYMAEQAKPGLTSILIMSLVLAIKGRIIVDHFMELKDAHVVLRTLMRVYFYVIPTLIILVYLFPEQIVKWTVL